MSDRGGGMEGLADVNSGRNAMQWSACSSFCFPSMQDLEAFKAHEVHSTESVKVKL